MGSSVTEHDPNLEPRTCYARGCRSIACIDANAAYQRQWRNSPSGITARRRRNDTAAKKRAQRARDDAALFSE